MYMIVRQVESQYLSLQTASTYPEPEDKEAFIRSQLYDYNYDGVSALPARYDIRDYSVFHPLANLGWIDFDLGCSTIFPS